MASQHVWKPAMNVRTVILKVTPAPVNLSERRAILRALKQHGEIEVFKRLHDPSSFISVAATETTARGLVARSPLQFDYAPAASAANSSVSPLSSSPTQPDHNPNSKTFLVKILPKPDYEHTPRLRESLLFGRWPQPHWLFSQTSFPTAVLRRSVPRDMAWFGLVDWESGAQVEGQEVMLAGLNSDRDFMLARRIRQMNKPAFDSLLDAWRRGAEERGELGQLEAGDVLGQLAARNAEKKEQES